ncbi:ABC transporter permease [Irregularibacter muris]|uniref:ABC transporter permease n=1 Tax=Irregularibacter muris TaxID=1796619 RepID=A0AAE3HI19_9FIRM|nr:ABC transporter permease [Irregularibacter muris]MCR1899932.1 ABC transporter permease [Irregularibacter muris]
MKQRKPYSIMIIRIFIIGFFLVFWEWAAQAKIYNSLFTSFPSDILKDLVKFYTSGDLVRHTSVTLQEAFMGLFYGTIAGIIAGLLLAQLESLGKILLPIITAIHGIPQLTLAPVYVLWFGLGMISKIFLAGLMVFFHVFFATYSGIQNVEPKLIESANLLGAGKIQTLIYVVLPSSMPWILSGIRIGVGSSLVGAIIGEYIGASAGFGWMIAYATSFFNIARVMSCILILLVVGSILNFILDKTENYLLRWRAPINLSINHDNAYKNT